LKQRIALTYRGAIGLQTTAIFWKKASSAKDARTSAVQNSFSNAGPFLFQPQKDIPTSSLHRDVGFR
jgi:hypothetical protein